MLFCATTQNLTAAENFMEWLAGPSVYPAPLKLNLEPEGDQEFLEAHILVGHQLQCTIQNKVYSDILAAKAPYRQRVALNTGLRAHLVSQRAAECVGEGADIHPDPVALLSPWRYAS